TARYARVRAAAVPAPSVGPARTERARCREERPAAPAWPEPFCAAVAVPPPEVQEQKSKRGKEPPREISSSPLSCRGGFYLLTRGLGRAAVWPPHSGSGHGRFKFLDFESLDDVADLDVLELLDGDAALEALPDLGNVIFEVAQRGNFALVDHAVVAQQTHARGPGNDSVDDHAAGDRPGLRHLERLADFGATLELLLEFWFQKSGHGRFDLVDQVVDDGVEPDVDAFFLRQLGRIAFGAHVETDHDGIRRRRQEHIIGRNRTHRGVNDVDLDLIGGELAQSLVEHLD